MTKLFSSQKLSALTLALLLAACGGGGGSSDTPATPDPEPTPTPDPEPEVKAITLTQSADTFKNSLYCNGNAANEDPQCQLRIFQIMVESFRNGDDSINYNVGYGTSDHKGDIQGVIDSLDYIKSLGMNTIWLTPVFESVSLSESAKQLDATGYYARNYFKVDPHFGSEEKLQELIDTAHAKGIYVLLDGVFGHFRKDISVNSENGSVLKTTTNCTGADGKPYNSGSDALCADFSDAGTKAFFIDVATHYIKNFKIDGWRLDQAYQVPVDAWRDIRIAVEQAAKKTTYKDASGNEVPPLGYMVGEIWTGNDGMVSKGYGQDTEGLNSVFAFNTRYGLVQALATEEWSKSEHTGERIQRELVNAENDFPARAIPNSFISNHDIVRFGDLIQRAKKGGLITNELYWERCTSAQTFLASISGPITNFYGEEFCQEVPNFDVKKNADGYYDDHVARINGKTSDFSTDEDKMKGVFTRLMTLRSKSPALYEGKNTLLTGDSQTFALQKTYNDSEALLIMNLNENHSNTYSFDGSKILSKEDTITDIVSCLRYTFDGTSFTVTLKPMVSALLVPKSEAAEVCK